MVYTANIQWRSRDGYLVFVTESNKQTFQTNAAVLTALTPDTEYEIYVSMLTERGQGPITTKLVSTMPALKGKLLIDLTIVTKFLMYGLSKIQTAEISLKFFCVCVVCSVCMFLIAMPIYFRAAGILSVCDWTHRKLHKPTGSSQEDVFS